MNDEPILKENPTRFTLFPLNKKYLDIWDLYKKSTAKRLIFQTIMQNLKN